MSYVGSREAQRDNSPAGTWNRAQFESSLDLLRTLSLPESVVEYCQRRARETGQLPHEFVTEIVEERRHGRELGSPVPLALPIPARRLRGRHARSAHRGTRSPLTAESVLLSLGLLVVLIGITVAFQGMLHHAISDVNVWVASLNPP